MTWHCKSCNRNFITDPKIREKKETLESDMQILFCPYCNSDKIENLSELKK